MFKLSTMAVGSVTVKRRGCSRKRERHVHRSNGERNMKHLETERTVRAGLRLGRGGSGKRCGGGEGQFLSQL